VIEEHETVAPQMLDVLERTRLEIVDADHPVAVGDEEVAKVGTEEACPSCDDGGRHLADATEAF
jgi:hypothetical protein